MLCRKKSPELPKLGRHRNQKRGETDLVQGPGLEPREGLGVGPESIPGLPSLGGQEVRGTHDGRGQKVRDSREGHGLETGSVGTGLAPETEGRANDDRQSQGRQKTKMVAGQAPRIGRRRKRGRPRPSRSKSNASFYFALTA